MRHGRKLFVLLAVVLVPICMTSCIEFKKQVMTYCYDADKDEIRIFQIYEGIYAEGSDGKITAEERQQLGDVIMGQRTFFFSNWILEYNRNQIKEQLVAAKKELADGEEVDDNMSKEVKLEIVEIMELLLSSVKVTNGQFYLNKDKELCAYQEVTISNASKLVAKLNRAANLALEHEGIDGFDEEQLSQLKKFYETSKWIELDGNQVVVLFPQSRENHFEMRKSIADGIRGDEAKILADIVENDVQMSYQEPLIKVTVGSKGTPHTQLQIGNLFDEDYNTLALDYVHEHYTVKEELDVDGIRDAFLND